MRKENSTANMSGQIRLKLYKCTKCGFIYKPKVNFELHKNLCILNKTKIANPSIDSESVEEWERKIDNNQIRKV